MLKIRKMSQASSSSATGRACRTPEVIDYGQLVLVDSAKIDSKANKVELNEDNSDLLSYVIMPQLGMNLE